MQRPPCSLVQQTWLTQIRSLTINLGEYTGRSWPYNCQGKHTSSDLSRYGKTREKGHCISCKKPKTKTTYPKEILQVWCLYQRHTIKYCIRLIKNFHIICITIKLINFAEQSYFSQTNTIMRLLPNTVETTKRPQNRMTILIKPFDYSTKTRHVNTMTEGKVNVEKISDNVLWFWYWKNQRA